MTVAALIERIDAELNGVELPDRRGKMLRESQAYLRALTEPGTPLGRLASIAQFAQERWLCTGAEAKPAELFVIDRIIELEAENERLRAAVTSDYIFVKAENEALRNSVEAVRAEYLQRVFNEKARADRLEAELAVAVKWHEQDEADYNELRAETIEECAKLCEGFLAGELTWVVRNLLQDAANAIRALKEPK